MVSNVILLFFLNKVRLLIRMDKLLFGFLLIVDPHGNVWLLSIIMLSVFSSDEQPITK